MKLFGCLTVRMKGEGVVGRGGGESPVTKRAQSQEQELAAVAGEAGARARRR